MTVPAAASTRTVAPQSVVVSFWLYVVGAVLGLLVALAGILLLPQTIAATRAALARTTTTGSGVDLESLATGSAIGGAVIGTLVAVAFSVLTILFARKMRAGRNWARIVLAVFAAVQIFGLAAAYGLGALHVLVLLAALVLSFLPVSNAFFRSVAAGPSGTV